MPAQRSDGARRQGDAAGELLDLLMQWRDDHDPSTLTAIAAKAGLSKSYLSEVFKGQKIPSPDAAADIIQAIAPDQAMQMRVRQMAEHAADASKRGRRART